MTQLPHLRTSERSTFKRCPQKWWWGYREGYDLIGPPAIQLWFGTGWHLVMAHRYGLKGTKRGKTPLKVWRDYVNGEQIKLRMNYEGDGLYHDEVYVGAGELGEEMIKNYLDEYGADEHVYMLQVERAFQVQIAGKNKRPLLQYDGTYDGVYRDLRKEEVWLWEHKTAKAISTGHLALDDQAGSYWAIATAELRAGKMIGPRESLEGIMYNFARKAVADDRPINADGLRTNKPTKEHHVAQLTEAGFTATMSMTAKALENLAAEKGITVLGDPSSRQPLPLFLREPVHRTANARNRQIQKIGEEFITMDLMRRKQLPVYKTPARDCNGGCQFYQMCILHEQNSDWQEFADATLLRRDPYEAHRKSADTGE